jgi:HlyD family secretion protein
VKKNDEQVELDAEEIQNNLLNSQADVSRAEADLLNAEKGIEISDLKGATDMQDARLRVQLAELDLRKYIEAEYPQQKRKAEVAINLAEEDLKRAKDKMDSTRQLVEKGYTNRTELEADELAVTRREIELINAKEDLKILTEYSSERRLSELKNSVDQAKAALDRLEKTIESERARDLANLESRKVNLSTAKNRLANVEDQLSKSKIYSDFDGMVFYPTSSGRYGQSATIELGASVYPRQDLLNFPDLKDWKIVVGVPESIIDKVARDQRAFATIDAVPGVLLEAVVSRVGIVPDRGRWYDRSSKTYSVELDVPVAPSVELKPGMSTTVEIITAEHKDILKVPIQAVTRQDEKYYVFDSSGQRVEVEVGASNEDSIQITKGLEEGDVILLYAPVSTETRAGLRERPLDQVKGEESGTTTNGSSETKTENSRDSEEPVRSETPQETPAPEAVATPAVEGGERRRPNLENMTPEQREAFRRRMEERQKQQAQPAE